MVVWFFPYRIANGISRKEDFFHRDVVRHDICARKNSCIIIRAVHVFSMDHLKTIVLLSEEKDGNSLVLTETAHCLPPGYHELFSNTGVFILIAVCGYKLLVIVPIPLVFPSETSLSPTLSCLNYQSVPASPAHYRLSSLSSF